MYASAGVGVLALLLGMCFTRSIKFLKRFCIPAPVSGGPLISLLTLLLFSVFGIECRFDGTVKDICMMLFFTSVGFQSDIRVLRTGGRPLLVMILLVAVLIASQNLISVGIAKCLGLSPLFGMAAGSIPMSGGHGTSGGFAPLLEQMGLAGASSITMAAATFGLVAGALLGRNYDSAVLVSGLCGFGLGATPNAMANMSAVCYKYRYSAAPFVIVPIIGAMFVDIINTGIVTLFLNIF